VHDVLHQITKLQNINFRRLPKEMHKITQKRGPQRPEKTDFYIQLLNSSPCLMWSKFCSTQTGTLIKVSSKPIPKEFVKGACVSLYVHTGRVEGTVSPDSYHLKVRVLNFFFFCLSLKQKKGYSEDRSFQLKMGDKLNVLIHPPEVSVSWLEKETMQLRKTWHLHLDSYISKLLKKSHVRKRISVFFSPVHP